MSIRERVDPDVLRGLDAYLSAIGPGGLSGIVDIHERRARYAELTARRPDVGPGVSIEERSVPGPPGSPEVRTRVYCPAGQQGALPVVCYIHGGGMVMGSAEADDAAAARVTRELGCVTVSVDYRLAPEHPHPAPVEDCYAVVSWLAGDMCDLEIDPGRLALYGLSSGGGLAAGTALLARDRNGPRIALTLLAYPMLDDRCETRSMYEVTGLGSWDRRATVQSWAALLSGDEDQVPCYAAPARASDLTGLGSTYIDVGQLDVFRDEDVAYASRLMQAGVETELHVYPGGIHSSEIWAPDAPLSRSVFGYRFAALRRALAG